MFNCVNLNLPTTAIAAKPAPVTRLLVSSGMGGVANSDFYSKFGLNPGFEIEEVPLPAPYLISRCFQFPVAVPNPTLLSLENYDIRTGSFFAARPGQAWLSQSNDQYQINAIGGSVPSVSTEFSAIARPTVPIPVAQTHTVDMADWGVSNITVDLVESGGLYFQYTVSDPQPGQYTVYGTDLVIVGYSDFPLAVGSTLQVTLSADTPSPKPSFAALFYHLPEVVSIDFLEEWGLVMPLNRTQTPRDRTLYWDGSTLIVFIGFEYASAIQAVPLPLTGQGYSFTVAT